MMWMITGCDVFVVIEFTGFARPYNIRNILEKFAPGTAILEIDPLTVSEDYCWDNRERARQICKTITAAQPSRVALIAYCAGCDLASQVASELASVDVCVTGCALLDPIAVTSTFIHDALGEIAESLRRNITVKDYEALHLDSSSLCDTSHVENTLLSWTCDYASDALGVSAESEPLIEQLAERYISWISFLCATAWANEEMSRPFAVFTSEEGLKQLGDSAKFPDDVLWSYATQGAPCLTADQCILDFGNWAAQTTAL